MADLIEYKKDDLGVNSTRAFAEAMKVSPLLLPMIVFAIIVAGFLALL